MILPLPKQFAYLAAEKGPNILLEMLKFHGLKEVPGPASSSIIMGWAREVGALSYYPSDATPWCALAMAHCAKAAGFDLPPDPLAALSWAKFGVPAPNNVAMLGDVLVKARVGGGHVGLYAGETNTHYAVIGGNQADSVCIAWFVKSAFSHIRRCKWRIAQPANVRRIVVGAPAERAVSEA